MQVRSAKGLKVYQMAYALAMEIFCLSKGWPSEEKYSLTDRNYPGSRFKVQGSRFRVREG